MTAALTLQPRRPSTSQAARGFDAVSLLTLYLVLLVGLPSQFVVGPLGGAGTPALLLGVGCLGWWLFDRCYSGAPPATGRQPVRAATVVFVVAVLLSYIAACLRPINAAELSTATLGLITLAGWVGVLLLAHDGIDDVGRLNRLLGRLTLAGALLAAFGLVQFFTHQAWTDHISVPGLSLNNTLYGSTYREGFTRPSGTAVHPIEFGAVLAMLLPISLARAATATSRGALSRCFPPAVILVAVSLSSSRSALITAAVGCVVLLPALQRPVRRVVAAGLGVLGAAVFVLVPGMIGTILGLFTGVGDDSSARSRLDSYAIAADYLAHTGPFGRGMATFMPSYRIFDNQILLMSVEIGVVGVLAILLLLASAVLAGSRAALAAENQVRVTLQGVVAAVAAGGASLALFDAFSFPMVPGLLFLLLGLVGGYRRQLGLGAADQAG